MKEKRIIDGMELNDGVYGDHPDNVPGVVRVGTVRREVISQENADRFLADNPQIEEKVRERGGVFTISGRNAVLFVGVTIATAGIMAGVAAIEIKRRKKKKQEGGQVS